LTELRRALSWRVKDFILDPFFLLASPAARGVVELLLFHQGGGKAMLGHIVRSFLACEDIKKVFVNQRVAFL
jgi:hypothetical protein